MPLTYNSAPQPNLPSIGDSGFEIQMEIADLGVAPTIRVLDNKTGETHYLSLEAVENIRNFAGHALRGLTEVNWARFVTNHPSLNPDLVTKVRQSNLARAVADAPLLGYTLLAAAPDVDEAGETSSEPREGEPKLTWKTGDNAGEGCGWSLTLHSGSNGNRGTEETVLGFAAWNDPAGISRLVDSLQDRDSVFVISGVVDSASTARLSSRLSAVTMRKARRLPAIRLKGAREILTSAGLVSPGNNHQTKARGRVLSIQVDDSSVPVAVAIVAPQRPVTCEPFPDGLEAMSWEARYEVTNEIEQRGRAIWSQRAKAALAEEGWRLVDLPLPNNQYNVWRLRYGVTNPDFFYVTRIKEELWSEIYPAALNAAETANLNRSSVI